MNLNRVYRLHFIGIGGIGMSGIAEIFLSQGHEVSGSDLSLSETTERLVRLGATIFSSHHKDNIKAVDVVVTSSAVKKNNPEVLEAKRLGIPVIPRAEMLAEIMRGKTGVAVAGTHGKTTTTSMTAQILMEAGLDPTVVVGGKVEAIGSNAKVGGGTIVVAEADESDGSFHLLPATHAIITNIDLDHMEHYGTRENLDEAFIHFAKQIPFYGCVWICLEDAGVRKVIPHFTKPFHTYGFTADADLYATEVKTTHGVQTFQLYYRAQKGSKHEDLGEITLSVLGLHNVLNSLAAMGMSLSLGAKFDSIKKAMLGFSHVKRRFDQKFYSEERGIRVVDDYGHHPTEIRAVLATAKQAGHKRIVTVFQPHRYSRTQLCWDEFLSCFRETDVLLMLPIYAASEDPIEGISQETLLSAIRKDRANRFDSHLAPNLDDARDWIVKNHLNGDLILTLGAGSITKLGDLLSSSLALPSSK